MPPPALSLVIPFYNEEEGCELVIQRLVEKLEYYQIDYELIPVNNGSTDQTEKIIDRCAQQHPRIKVVTVACNQGYGWGILSGLSQSTGRFVGYVDGDLQVPPDAVIRVFNCAREQDADIGKGTRVTRSDGLKRRIISTTYNIMFKVLFHCPVQDVNAKPKVMKRHCLSQLDLQSKDWFIDAELIIKAHAYGMRIAEVPIDFLPRKQGASKIRMGAIFEFIRNLLVYRLTSGKRLRSTPQIQTGHQP